MKFEKQMQTHIEKQQTANINVKKNLTVNNAF